MDRNLDYKLSQSELGRDNSEIFLLLDANGDGYVTHEEMEHMMNVLQAQHDNLEKTVSHMH